MKSLFSFPPILQNMAILWLLICIGGCSGSAIHRYSITTLGTIGIKPGLNLHYIILYGETHTADPKKTEVMILWLGPPGVSASAQARHVLMINDKKVVIPKYTNDPQIAVLTDKYILNTISLTPKDARSVIQLVLSSGIKELRENHLWNKAIRMHLRQVNP